MTQEEKDLLLKELCARLPYGVKINLHNTIFEIYFVEKQDLHNVYVGLKENNEQVSQQTNILNIKPYLRPMSSRTEEEDDFIQQCMDIVEDENYHDGFSPSAWSSMGDFVNYCNQHYLDYNGLIGKGLALEAPEDMYKNV